MKRLIALLGLLVAIMGLLVIPAPLANAQDCVNHSSAYDAGKTAEGFHSVVTAGCHRAEYTGSTTDTTGSGSYTFRTVGNLYQWEQGNNLPGPEGGNYCQYRAVDEANRIATNLFKLPVGSEVTVRYRCY